MGRPEEFPRQEQESPEAMFFFHSMPKAYLSVHIGYTKASFHETNADGYKFASTTNLQEAIDLFVINREILSACIGKSSQNSAQLCYPKYF